MTILNARIVSDEIVERLRMREDERRERGERLTAHDILDAFSRPGPKMSRSADEPGGLPLATAWMDGTA